MKEPPQWPSEARSEDLELIHGPARVHGPIKRRRARACSAPLAPRLGFGYEPLSWYESIDRPELEIGDHPVDTRLVRVGFKCQPDSWGAFAWIRPLVCRWKIHLGRDHIIIVNPRIVRDPTEWRADRPGS